MKPANIRYGVSDRILATHAGGIGLMHSVVANLGLPRLIDDKVKLLKRHRPIHESDHVLSLAYSLMCGETTLDDLAARREDRRASSPSASARRRCGPWTCMSLSNVSSTTGRFSALACSSRARSSGFVWSRVPNLRPSIGDLVSETVIRAAFAGPVSLSPLATNHDSRIPASASGTRSLATVTGSVTELAVEVGFVEEDGVNAPVEGDVGGAVEAERVFAGKTKPQTVLRRLLPQGECPAQARCDLNLRPRSTSVNHIVPRYLER